MNKLAVISAFWGGVKNRYMQYQPNRSIIEIIEAAGKIDYQTQFGKTPFGVAQIASKYNVPVFALTGIIGEGSEVLLQKGITAYFALADKPMSMEESKENARYLLEKTIEQVMRIIIIQSTKS